MKIKDIDNPEVLKEIIHSLQTQIDLLHAFMVHNTVNCFEDQWDFFDARKKVCLEEKRSKSR